MQDRRRFLVASVACLAAAISLQGCGSDEEGSASPSPDPTPTPNASGSTVSLTSDLEVAQFDPRPNDAFQLNGFTLTINQMADTVRTGIFIGEGKVVIRSKLARPEWWSTPSYRRAAMALMAGGGGVVLLQSARYPSESSAANPLPLSNVTFFGAGQPEYNSDYTALTGGSILEGPVIFASRDAQNNALGDNIAISNLGVDAGERVSAAKGAAQEGLSFPNIGQIPDGKVGLRINIRIQDVIVLCRSANAPVHCILIEQADRPSVRSVRTVFGENGIVLKTRRGLVDGASMRGHATNCWIDKSDIYSLSMNNIWRGLDMGSIAANDTFGGRIQCGSAVSSGHYVSDVNGNGIAAVLSLEPGEWGISDVTMAKISGEDLRFFGVLVGTGSQRIALTDISASRISDPVDGTYGNALQISPGVDTVTITGFKSSSTVGDGVRNQGTNVTVSDGVAESPGPGRFGFNGVSGSMKLLRCSGTRSGAVE